MIFGVRNIILLIIIIMKKNLLMTWEQFVWSMEVVHSRSFCGDGFGGGFGGLLVSSSAGGGGGGGSVVVIPPIVMATAGPAVSAIMGFIYYVTFHGQNDMVLVGLAIIGIVLPALINLLSGTNPNKSSVAVLLPLIDSANHLEEADSIIEYNPLEGVFTLRIGNNCIVVDDDEDKPPQLYISYGKKKDTELLLNYGFLPDIMDDGNNNSNNNNDDDENERRLNLAKAFIERN